MIMKKNNKGFVLVETLIVSVAIAAIFTSIYVNLIPVLGEYEKVEAYDDLDTKYVAHWMRMLIIKRGNSNLYNNMEGVLKTQKLTYIKITSNDCRSYFTNTDECVRFFKEFNVTQMYITKFSLDQLKAIARTDSQINNSPGFQNYVLSLPSYNYDNVGNYRILVETEHNVNLKGSDDYFKSYATVEVNRDVTKIR